MIKKLAGKKLKKSNKENKTAVELVFVLDNLEYARNVASIFNLAYALKISKIYLTGFTTSPPFGKELTKVSRGHEKSISFSSAKSVSKLLEKLVKEDFQIIAIGKTNNSVEFSKLRDGATYKKVAIMVGNEKQGLSNILLNKAELRVFVPVYRPLAHLNVVNELAVVAYNII
jgi:tRNA G18 (ribose-2'-O)-methylase SpoU